MCKWIYFRDFYVEVLIEIVSGREERMRISTFLPSLRYIVHERIKSGSLNIDILL